MLFALGVYPTPLVHLIQVTAAQMTVRQNADADR
jgi:hypothetical protein